MELLHPEECVAALVEEWIHIKTWLHEMIRIKQETEGFPEGLLDEL